MLHYITHLGLEFSCRLQSFSAYTSHQSQRQSNRNHSSWSLSSQYHNVTALNVTISNSQVITAHVSHCDVRCVNLVQFCKVRALKKQLSQRIKGITESLQWRINQLFFFPGAGRPRLPDSAHACLPPSGSRKTAGAPQDVSCHYSPPGANERRSGATLLQAVSSPVQGGGGQTVCFVLCACGVCVCVLQRLRALALRAWERAEWVGSVRERGSEGEQMSGREFLCMWAHRIPRGIFSIDAVVDFFCFFSHPLLNVFAGLFFPVRAKYESLMHFSNHTLCRCNSHVKR